MRTKILIFLIREQEINKVPKNVVLVDSLNNRLFFKRGLVYKEQKKIQKAIEDIERAILLNPEDFYSHNNLGDIYSQKEQFSKASKYYEKALSIKKNPDTFIRQGENYLRMKDTLYAEIEFKKAIQIDSMSTLAYLNLGLIAHDKSNYSESIQLFNSSLNSFRPDQKDYSFKDLKSLILTYRGLAKFNNGDRNGACEDWISKINESKGTGKI